MLISAEYPSSHTSSPSIGSILLSTRHPPSLGEALQLCSLALPAPTLVLRGTFACSPCSVRSCRACSEAVHLLCLAPHPGSSPPGLLGRGCMETVGCGGGRSLPISQCPREKSRTELWGSVCSALSPFLETGTVSNFFLCSFQLFFKHIYKATFNPKHSGFASLFSFDFLFIQWAI